MRIKLHRTRRASRTLFAPERQASEWREQRVSARQMPLSQVPAAAPTSHAACPNFPKSKPPCAALSAVLDGETLAEVVPRRADLRWPMPADLRQRMTGARVTGTVAPRQIRADSHRPRRHVDIPPGHVGPLAYRPRKHRQARSFHTAHRGTGLTLALNDPRRFGSLDLMPTNKLESFPAFAKMGPEPLGSAFDAAYLHAMLKNRRSPVKLSLLDQRIVAGLGNIYVCEALNMAGISPNRKAGNIGKVRLQKLVTAIKRCCYRPSMPAGRRCATMPGPTANSAILRSSGASMAARAGSAPAAAPSPGSRKAGAAHSGAAAASG